MSLDLEKHLTFVSGRARISGHTMYDPWQQLIVCLQYGAYHHNQVNIAIHMVCVPLILFSAFEMVCNSCPEPMSDWQSDPDPDAGFQLWALLHAAVMAADALS